MLEHLGTANSSYDALEASLRKRFGQTIDDASSFNMAGSASKPVAGENVVAQDPFNLAAERGRSLFDSRHRHALSYQWAIPLWRQPHGW